MAVIIELLGWGGKRQRYFRVETSSVTIGRGYENDVVLDDAHISPNHLRRFLRVALCKSCACLDSPL